MPPALGLRRIYLRRRLRGLGDGPGAGQGARVHQSFPPNEALPRKVRAVIDTVGLDSWAHSLSSLARGGTLVTVGGTTGFDVPLNLLPVFTDQITITGSIMGTLKDMEDMMRLMARAGIEPEIGVVLPMERAEEGFRAMWEDRTHGKTVFTR